jgi:peptidoglycan-N-acetylglucosamine deacetylase
MIKKFINTIKYLFSSWNPYIKYLGNAKNNTFFLTFDDGPHEQNTPKILEILKKYNVKATFFIVGSIAEKYPQLVKLIWKDGHEVANHSYSHNKNNYSVSEIAETNNVIKGIIGITPKYYRPPWGKIELNQLVYIIINKMKLILWHINSFDHIIKDSNQLINVIKTTKIISGDIILFHENRDHTIKALPEIIEYLKFRNLNLIELNRNWKSNSSCIGFSKNS